MQGSRNSAEPLAPPEPLAFLTYRSAATVLPSESDLDRLVAAAQRRNRSLGITGMLLYDRGNYFQTLEGSPDKLESVWDSIRRDPRHTGIELLNQNAATTRLFSEWHMRLVTQQAAATRSAHLESQGTNLLSILIPEAGRSALADDGPALSMLFEPLIAKGWALSAIIKYLIEPAGRTLGDAWLTDVCTDFELTAGLIRLQTAAHELHANHRHGIQLSGSRKSILIVSAPNESHIMGATLLGDLFTNAQWSVDIAFPADAESLVARLSTMRPDVVDIGLSDALQRRHALGDLTRVVEACRRASPADKLVVSVGGRVFADSFATAGTVGADYARLSAAGTVSSIANILELRDKAMPVMPSDMVEPTPDEDRAVN